MTAFLLKRKRFCLSLGRNEFKMIKQGLKIAYVIFLLFTFSCDNSIQNNNSSQSFLDKEDAENHEIALDTSSLTYNLTGALWGYRYDTISKDFKVVKLRNFNKDTLTPKIIESIINEVWEKVQIKYLRIQNDTIFIAIPHSEVLTQQMGTTGADEFMISTTYSFTELKGINFVSYDFEFGDHASPGIYNRRSWSKN